VRVKELHSRGINHLVRAAAGDTPANSVTLISRCVPWNKSGVGDLNLAHRLDDRRGECVSYSPAGATRLGGNAGEVRVRSSLHTRHTRPLLPVIVLDQTLIIASAAWIMIARYPNVA